MSVYVRPFRASDLDEFVPIEPMKTDGLRDIAKDIEDSGLAVSGVRNGKVVGCGGVHPVNEEVGELWLRLSGECLKHRIDTLRWLISGMKIIEDVFPFKQLDLAVLKCFDKSIRLVEYLGFKKTQIRKDYFIYSKRVKE